MKAKRTTSVSTRVVPATPLADLGKGPTPVASFYGANVKHDAKAYIKGIAGFARLDEAMLQRKAERGLVVKGPRPCRGAIEYLLDDEAAQATFSDPELRSDRQHMSSLRRFLRTSCKKKWETMTEEQKKKYVDAAEADRKRFVAERNAWRQIDNDVATAKAQRAAQKGDGSGTPAAADAVLDVDQDKVAGLDAQKAVTKPVGAPAVKRKKPATSKPAAAAGTSAQQKASKPARGPNGKAQKAAAKAVLSEEESEKESAASSEEHSSDSDRASSIDEEEEQARASRHLAQDGTADEPNKRAAKRRK